MSYISRKNLVLLISIALVFVSFTKAHKFYLSVTELTYVPQKQSVQIITRIFIDDLEQLLQERYALQTYLHSDKEDAQTNYYIQKYLEKRLTITLNNKKYPVTFLGKVYEDDVVKCYLEVTGITQPTVHSLTLTNTILCDLFADQKNIVHIKAPGFKKSVLLFKEEPTALVGW